jgi:hypothetical protein
MDKIIKESLEKATQHGAEIENIRICKILSDKIMESDNIEVNLAFMKLLNEL